MRVACTMSVTHPSWGLAARQRHLAAVSHEELLDAVRGPVEPLFRRISRSFGLRVRDLVLGLRAQGL